MRLRWQVGRFFIGMFPVGSRGLLSNDIVTSHRTWFRPGFLSLRCRASAAREPAEALSIFGSAVLASRRQQRPARSGAGPQPLSPDPGWGLFICQALTDIPWKGRAAIVLVSNIGPWPRRSPFRRGRFLSSWCWRTMPGRGRLRNDGSVIVPLTG